ncbi:MAG: ChbG/HpnK family deacetylase [Myxococcaceae bacterium]|nr:ChbG/HpnK family deacetylase [Myxococcaceae bacterium]MCI0669113.1 ChbG/HpnK family deacetylase [Myxococcaceae bacterium]
MPPRALIINADDLGYDPAVTRGILLAMREGIVSSTTFMVNMPSSEEAARQAQGLAVGLHLNLARGRPVSSRFPAAHLVEGSLSEARAGGLLPETVEAETLAQLDRLEALLGRPATHVDVHKHLHRHPGVLEGLARAARARGLPVRSLDGDMRQALGARGVATNTHFLGDAGAEPYWTEARLVEALGSLPTDGVVELMCHPGYRPEAVQSGYSAQREVELLAFLSKQARSALAHSGVPRADFRVLHSH